jgi:signal transduction histidine kinase
VAWPTDFHPNTTMEPATKARIGALILTAVPVTALGVVAGVGAGISPLACAPVALVLGLALGALLAGSVAVDPEPDTPRPEPQTFGVRALLTRAAHESRPVLGEVDVLVDVVPPRLRTVGDPECLHRAVAEVIEQAARRSPPGSVLTLAARSASPGGVRLEIVDEGGGDCDAGLAVARGIVDRHGGALRAERARPHGCRVVVELPGA